MSRKRGDIDVALLPCVKRCDDGSLLLAVHVQPKASRDAVCGLHGDSLKVAIKSPPVDGKANKYLIGYLAGVFGVTKRDVELLSGHASRKKTFEITGRPGGELLSIVEGLLK